MRLFRRSSRTGSRTDAPLETLATAGPREYRHQGTLRLVVVQALVLSLFVTLFARLWYLQVLGGESYQAQAAEQSVRELVVQPARGLIVDDMGRPLVASRTSWVVTVDRTLLHKLDGDDQETLLRRVAHAVGSLREGARANPALRRAAARSRGPAGTARRTSPSRSPRTSANRWRSSIMEQGEDFPAVLVGASRTSAPTRRRTASTPRTCSATSARSPRTSSTRPRPRDDTSVHGASVVGRAGLEKQYDRYLRGHPGYKSVAVDSMGRVLGRPGETAGQVGDTLVTSIDPAFRRSSSSSSRRPSRRPVRRSTR